MNEEKLDPCKSCGGIAKLAKDFLRYTYIQCVDCGTRTRECGSEDTAIKCWNRRPEKKVNEGLNYVNVVGAGRGGWLNILIGETILCQVTHTETADKMRALVPERELKNESN